MTKAKIIFFFSLKEESIEHLNTISLVLNKTEAGYLDMLYEKYKFLKKLLELQQFKEAQLIDLHKYF